MAWLELDDGIWEHHKTAKLCVALKISEVQCVGHLISLWHFVLRNAWRDANLEAWGEYGIEKAARWSGKKGEFIKEARNCGIIDGFVSHGWMKRAGRLVYDRLRKEAEREGTVHKLSRTKGGLSVATVPNSTVPNRTEEKKQIKNAPDKPDAASKGSGPVNWDNCRSDLQRLIAHFVKITTPALYENCSQAQANGIFKVQGRAASEILKQCGTAEIACRVIDKAAKYFYDKGLDWSLHAVNRSCTDYVNEILKEKDYAP